MNRYVVLDIETTGTHPIRNEIIEIGAVYVENGQVIKKFNELICPRESISEYITGITGIDDTMVADAPPIEEVMPRFIDFCEDVPLIGHNIILFDYRMLKAKAVSLGFEFEKKGLDTLNISRKVLGNLPSRRLGALCEYYQINLEHAHRAYDDAFATYELFKHLEEDFSRQHSKLFIPEPMIWELPKWEPMTQKQKAYLFSLCQKHQLELEVNLERLSKSEASRLIDKIIAKHGRIIRV